MTDFGCLVFWLRAPMCASLGGFFSLPKRYFYQYDLAMKQVILQVEENNYEGLVSFLKSLDFVVLEEEIPMWQQNEVAERRAAYDAGTLLSRKWHEAQKNIFNCGLMINTKGGHDDNAGSIYLAT
jgi:hypothetical protein